MSAKTLAIPPLDSHNKPPTMNAFTTTTGNGRGGPTRWHKPHVATRDAGFLLGLLDGALGRPYGDAQARFLIWLLECALEWNKKPYR